ncbi:type I polyketide synthase [Polyangium aurulentum]|uniref:type I polyketide synthase n=1 Tax=Polyangium aurulentum TaxID=2567896 RepID=UPI00146F49DE|nr:type I polyketide synthase [Polyangium aurulentum]UQA61059.1 KR domain-containing protein [Polyangium aurulentum]
MSPLERALLALEKMEAKLAAAERERSEPIAIVGLGCRFPGGGDDPGSFWRALRDGTDAITEIGPERWGTSAAAGSPSVSKAGVLPAIDQFDAAFFGVSSREAAAMDPQHRLLLEVAWEALEDAAIPAPNLEGSRTGVFFGLSAHDYERVLSQVPHEMDIHEGTGNSACFAAGRASHFLGLRGPCLTIDAACASSLASVHLACGSLRRRDCDMALAGGVHLILSPLGSAYLAALQILSPDGRCRVLDAEAAGYGRADGCGVVVLKRLSDALRDGDRIRALIRGSASTHNGRSTSLTAPSVQAEAVAVRDALADARVQPTQIGYVELHSTGSPLGDAVEIDALKEVLGGPRADGSACVLGSVRTNLGHTEAASGMASLIKAVLCLESELIPRNLHFKRLNPRISLDGTPFAFPTVEVPWRRASAPRFAGVSSSGISGTNVHAVLEEAPLAPRPAAAAKRPLHLLPLSGRDEAARDAQVSRLIAHLSRHPELPLEDVCHTAAAGRTHFEHRIALVVTSREQTLQDLQALRAGEAPRSCARGYVARGIARSRVAFVVAGEASQMRGFEPSLYDALPALRDAVVECDAIIQPLLGRSITPYLLAAGPAFASPVDEPVGELGLFVLQYALARLWRSWGVEPNAVLGDGVGECVAACVAGVFRLEDALALTAARASLRSSARGGAEALEQVLSRIRFGRPRIAFIGGAQSGPPTTPDFWRDWARAPARREESAARLARQEYAALIRVGPAPSKQEHNGLEAASLLPSLQHDQGDWQTLLSSLGHLYARGIDVDWNSFDKPFSFRRVALPTYPFQRKRCWVEAIAGRGGAQDPSGEHPLLGQRLAPFAHEPDLAGWELALDRTRLSRLGPTRVAGLSLLPLGAMIALAQAATREASSAGPSTVELFIEAPALLDEATSRAQVLVQTSPEGKAALQIFVRRRSAASWQRVARGCISPAEAVQDRQPVRPALPPRPELLEEIPASTWRRALAQAGVAPHAPRIDRVWQREGESLARLSASSLDADQAAGSLVQVAAALASITHPAGTGAPWLAQAVERLQIHAHGRGPAWLSLAWSARDAREAKLDAAWLAEDGTLLADARGIRLSAAEPFDLLRRAGEDSLADAFYERIWIVPPPSAPLAMHAAERRHFLILGDRGGLGETLSARMKDEGHSATLFSRDEFERGPERLDLVVATNRAFSDIVHLWGLDVSSADAPTTAAVLDAQRAGCDVALRLGGFAVEHPRPPRFWFVTRGAEPAGGAAASLEASALRGLARALAVEHPQLWAGTIDLDPDSDALDAGRLTEALLAPYSEDQIIHRRGRSLVARLARAPSPRRGEPLVLRSDRTYLVTGGAGALGLAIARRLIERGARAMVLLDEPVGARSLQARADGVRALETLGAEVRIEAADVADRQAMAQILERLPLPLGGVVHAAGATGGAEAMLFGAGAAEARASAFRTRILGALVLHELTLGTPLDFFVLMSSTALVHASRGHAHAAIADQFLATLAHHRRAQGLSGMSLQAAPLADAASSPELVASAWRAGLIPLSEGALLDALERALLDGRAEPIVARFDWEIIGAAYEPGRGTLFEGFASDISDLPRRLALASPEEGRRLLGRLCRAHVARLLERDPGELPEDRPFFELGLNSILGVQLTNALGDALGVTLPAALVLEHPTVSSLAEHLASRLLPGAAEVASARGAAGPWTYDPILPLRKSGARPPFFCVHPVQGMAVVFRALALHVGDDQPFYGLHARGVDSEDPPLDRFEDMAALYVKAIRGIQPQGPYRIGGYSYGAYVAFEMAQQLTRAGEQVEHLVLMDAPMLGAAENSRSPLALFVRWCGLDVDEEQLSRLSLGEQALYLARTTTDLLLLPPDLAESRRQLRVHEAHLAALISYVFAPYPGRITLLRAMEAVAGGSNAVLGPDYGWDLLCPGRVEMHDIPGTHFNAIAEPHVRGLAAVLRRILS